jgi:hypothetical protein
MQTHPVRLHPLKTRPPSDVACEYAALVRMLAGAQSRTTSLVCDHQQQIQALQAQIMRLRARVVVRDTLLAWLRETLAHTEPAPPEDLAPHHAAADRVICQTGCVSHGGYWRDDDGCRRTGKGCVLVEGGAPVTQPP